MDSLKDYSTGSFAQLPIGSLPQHHNQHTNNISALTLLIHTFIMATQAAQLQSATFNEGDKHINLWTKDKLFGDIPTADGNIRLLKMEQALAEQKVHGATGLANCRGVDPGAGGVGNAMQVQQHTDRCEATRLLILSMIDPGSRMFLLMNDPVTFQTGRHLFDYLHGPMVVYIAPQRDEVVAHKKMVSSLTWEDLPSTQKNPELVMNFKKFITSQNPNRHPAFDYNEAEYIDIFVDGVHAQAKVEATKLRNNLPYAVQQDCVHPANYPAHHPLNGNAHPRAGQLSLDAMAIYCSIDFSAKLRSGLFHLNTRPEQVINMVDGEHKIAPHGSPASREILDGDESTIFLSWDDVNKQGFETISQYLYYVNKSRTPTPKLFPTCKNCGGLFHFEYEDGKRVCPTPKDAVPAALLSQIKYPFGVKPWKFNIGTGRGGLVPRGYFKGGKGRGRGGGRGRGVFEFYGDEIDNTREIAEMMAMGIEEKDSIDQSSTASMSSSSGYAITDDFSDHDGWNM